MDVLEQINEKSRNIPNNVTMWDPLTLVGEADNGSLTLGPLVIDHGGRLLHDCTLTFELGVVLETFAAPAISSRSQQQQLPPGAQTITAAPFGIWIVQPTTAAPVAVDCMTGHWHGMQPFSSTWPLQPGTGRHRGGVAAEE
jgi:hypothetical protein